MEAEETSSRTPYDNYVDPGLTIVEYTRTQDQNDILGISDLKTENYGSEFQVDHGTDKATELSDR